MKSIPAVPLARFPGFTDNWHAKTLGELGTPYNGLSGKTAADFGQGAPYITYRQVYDSTVIDPMECEYVHIRPDEKQNLAQPGDIFFTGSSETADDVGYTAVLLESPGSMYLNSFCFGYRPGNELVPEFAQFLLGSQPVRRQIFRLSQGSTRYNLSKSELMKTTVHVPGVEEQRKIAGMLVSLDRNITVLTRQLQALELYQQSVIRKLFAGQVRFTRSDGTEYPAWKTKKLGELVSIKTGKKDVNQGNPKGAYPFFTCAREHTYSDSYSFEGEAIMVAGNGDVGLCTYYDGKFEAYQRTYVLQDFNLSAAYLFLYLKYTFQPFAESQKQQGSMPYIKLGTLQDFPIPTQDPEEQQKITEFATNLNDKVALMARRIELVSSLKTALVQELLSTHGK